MGKSIAILATLDTKGDQVEYLKKTVEDKGHRVILIDVGVLGEPYCEPEFDKNEVARASGMEIDELIALRDTGRVMDKMRQGAEKILLELYSKGGIDGVLAAGGSVGTLLALKVMKQLPFALPKVVLSTIAYSPAIDPDYLNSGIIMMQWAAGLWGDNAIVRGVLKQAAFVISAAAEAYDGKKEIKKKTIGVTALGMASTRYMFHLKPALEERGYEVAVFHSLGMNTRVLEKLIREGAIDAVIDLQVGGELKTFLADSLFSPGKNKLEAAAERGIPQIIGILSAGGPIFWSPFKKLPPEYENRISFKKHDLLWVLAWKPEILKDMSKLLSEKLNRAKGPTVVVLPRQPEAGPKGTVERREGIDPEEIAKMEKAEKVQPLPFEESYRIIGESLEKYLNSNIEIMELDMNPDDKEFSMVLVDLLDKMVK